jgi:hypothetical protein
MTEVCPDPRDTEVLAVGAERLSVFVINFNAGEDCSAIKTWGKKAGRRDIEQRVPFPC